MPKELFEPWLPNELSEPWLPKELLEPWLPKESLDEPYEPCWPWLLPWLLPNESEEPWFELLLPLPKLSLPPEDWLPDWLLEPPD